MSSNSRYTEVESLELTGGNKEPYRTMEPVKKMSQFMAAFAGMKSLIPTFTKCLNNSLITANLSSFALGTCLGWTSPIMPKLADLDSSPLDVSITAVSSEAGWIASLIAIGALVSE